MKTSECGSEAFGSFPKGLSDAPSATSRALLPESVGRALAKTVSFLIKISEVCVRGLQRSNPCRLLILTLRCF